MKLRLREKVVAVLMSVVMVWGLSPAAAFGAPSVEDVDDVAVATGNEVPTYTLKGDDDPESEDWISIVIGASPDEIIYDGYNWISYLEIAVVTSDNDDVTQDAELTLYKDGVEVEDAVDAGDYVIKATYNGMEAANNFKVLPLALTEDTVELYSDELYFTGFANAPEVMGWDLNGYRLDHFVEGTDYTLSYKDAADSALSGAPSAVGSYKAIVQAKSGNFTGSVALDFSIEPESLGYANWTLTPSAYVYTETGTYEPTVTGVLESEDAQGDPQHYTLEQGVDFTVTYSNNTGKGTAEAILKPVEGGNFTSSTDEGEKIPFKISDAIATVTHGDTVADFATIEEAFAAAQNGDTVTLQNEAYPEETLVVDNKAITLDLANSIMQPQTGFRTSVENPLIKITNGGSLTVKGNFGSSAGTLGNESTSYAIVVDGDGSELIAKSGTIAASSTAIYLSNGGYAEIDGGYVSAMSNTVRFADDQTVKSGIAILDGIVESESSSVIGASDTTANITITGGTVRMVSTNSSNHAILIMNGDNVELAITGGIIEGGAGDAINTFWGTPEIAITGGTFKGAISTDDVKEYILGGTFLNGEGTAALALDASYLAEGYVQDPETGKVEFVPTVVVVRGETLYEFVNINKAFAFAQDGDTVTLLANVDASETIVVDKQLTLDARSYILNAGFVTSETAPLIMVTSDGSLTASASGGSGSNRGGINTEAGYAIVADGGDLDLDCLVVAADSPAIQLGGGAHVALSGERAAVASAGENAAIKFAGHDTTLSTLDVADGMILAMGFESLPSAIDTDGAHAAINITGGQINASGDIIVLNGGTTELTITGGQLPASSGSNSIKVREGDPSIHISGGEFQGTIEAGNLTGFIAGGKFTNYDLTDTGYLASWVEQNLSTWEVHPKDGVEAVVYRGGEGVASGTLAEAVAASQAGDTVKLVSDVQLSEELRIFDNNNLTLDLGSFKISNAEGYTTGYSDNLIRIQSSTVRIVGNADSYITTSGSYAIHMPFRGELTIDGPAVNADRGSTIVLSDWLVRLTVESGIISSGSSSAIFLLSGDATINGGTITAAEDTINASGAVSGIIINGGTIAGDRAVNAAGEKLFISGGTILGTPDGEGTALNVDARVNGPSVSGGTFNGSVTSDKNGFITGGTFSSAVNAAYIAEGYVQDPATGKVIEDGITITTPDPATIVYDGTTDWLKTITVTNAVDIDVTEQATIEITSFLRSVPTEAIDAGTYNVKVSYNGMSENIELVVNKASIEGLTVTDAAPVFTGSAVDPGIVVKNGETTLEADTDYAVALPSDMTNAGAKTATITGTGNYTGEVTYDFAIVPAALESVTFTLTPDEYAFIEGGTYEPAVTAVLNADGESPYTLPEGSFTVSYSDNTAVGTATATVTVTAETTGNIAAGTKDLSFKIAPTVAMIGSTPYASLKSAAAAAQNGDTIVMVADETYGDDTVTVEASNVTLDLNGHIFRSTYRNYDTHDGYAVTVTGGLKVTDESEGGAGAIIGEQDGIRVTGAGTLTVAGGTITANAGTHNAYEAVAILADGSGDVSVTGGTVDIQANYGTVHNNYGTGIKLADTFTGDLDISGGSVTGIMRGILSEAAAPVINISGNASVSALRNGGSYNGRVCISVAGGELNLSDNATITSSGNYYKFLDAAITASGSTKITIADNVVIGGTVEGPDEHVSSGIVSTGNDVEVVMSSGSVYGLIDGINNAGGKVTVTGGTVSATKTNNGTGVIGGNVTLRNTSVAGQTGVAASGDLSVTNTPLDTSDVGIWLTGSGSEQNVTLANMNISGKRAIKTTGTAVKNIPITEGVTITSTASGSYLGGGIYRENGGVVNVTMTGGSVTASGESSPALSNLGGVATISGGTISGGNGGIYDSNHVSGATSVIISGGSIAATYDIDAWWSDRNDSYRIIAVYVRGDVTITGGTITSTEYCVADRFGSSGNITITGGTLTSTGSMGRVNTGEPEFTFGTAIAHLGSGTMEIGGDAVITGGTGVLVAGGTNNITGGTITANGPKHTPSVNGDTGEGLRTLGTPGDALAAICVGKSVSINVTGGAFKSEVEGSPVNSYLAKYYSYNDQTTAPAEFLFGGIYDEEPIVLGGTSLVSGLGDIVPNTDPATKEAYPYTIALQPAVAQIGTKQYRALDTAFANAADGDTIELLVDVEETSTIASTKNVALDLQGHTITSTGTDPVISVTAGTLTLTDSIEGQAGTLSAAAPVSVASGAGFVLDAGAVKATGTDAAAITTNGGTITVSGGKAEGATAINASGKSTITVSGGKVSGTTTGINAAGGTVTVSGGEVAGATGIDGSAAVTVSGGKVSGTATGIKATGNSGSVTVSGGEVTGDIAIDARVNVTISDGAKIVGTSKGVRATYRILNVSGGEISGDTGIEFNDGNTTGVDYNTINISGGKITGTTTGIKIDADDLTISGGEIFGGAIGAEINGVYSSIGGRGLISDGTITSDGIGLSLSGDSVVFTIDGGTITGAQTGLVYNSKYSSMLTLNGGTITGDVGFYWQDGYLRTNSGTKTVVNGTTIALHVAQGAVYSSEDWIRGGDYIAPDGEAIVYDRVNTQPNGNSLVAGGWFSNPVPYKIAASGMRPLFTPGVDGNGNVVEGKENLYTVGNGTFNPVAQVGTTLYESLPEAFAAAGDGDTVKLMANIELSEPYVYDFDPAKSVELDTASYTLQAKSTFDSSTYKTLIDVKNGTLTLAGGSLKGNDKGISLVTVREGAAFNMAGGSMGAAHYGITAEAGSDVVVAAQISDMISGCIVSNGATVMISDGASLGMRRSYEGAAIDLLGGDTLTVNGGTISGLPGIRHSARATAASTITINGGTVASGSSGPYYDEPGISLENTTYAATLTVAGGTVKGADYTNGYAISATGPSTVNINDGAAVTGDRYGIRISGADTKLSVSGGTVSTGNDAIIMQAGTFQITGGTITGYRAVRVADGAIVTGTISGGDLRGSGNYGIGVYLDGPDPSTVVTVTGKALVKGPSHALSNVKGYGQADFATLAMTGGYVSDSTLPAHITIPEGKELRASTVHEGYYELAALPFLKNVRTGDTYDSLEAAFAAAEAGDTIQAVYGFEVEEGVSLDKDITLDLNGKTVTYNSTAEGKDDYTPLITVEAGAKLAITGDGTITGPANGKDYDGKVLISVAGELDYVNGTMTATGEGSDGMYGVYVLDGGKATFGVAADEEAGTPASGPTITSHFAAIGTNNTTAPATVTVYGGEYTAQAAPAATDWWSYFCAPVYAAAAGTFDLQGGTYNGYYGISSRYANVDQDVTLGDVTLNGTSGIQVFVDSKSGTAGETDRHIVATGNTLTIPDGYAWKAGEGGTYEVVEAVAATGGKYYATLAEAIEAAQANDTVELLADTAENVTVDKAITLNMNGNELSSDQPELIIVAAGGDLKIIGNGKITGPANGQAFDSKSLIRVDGGTLAIENGTLTATGSGSDGMYGVYVLSGGTATFGTPDGSGPSITSHFAAIGTNNTTAPATIKVYGGEYIAQAAPAATDWWSYFCAPVYAAAAGTFDLQGGAFVGYYGISSRYANVDQDITLGNVAMNASSGTDVFVDSKPGTGTTDPSERHIQSTVNTKTLPEGYAWKSITGADPMAYEVAEAVASITKGEPAATTYYATLQDAVTAAQADDTVLLLKDVEENGVAVARGHAAFTLDLGEHKLSWPEASVSVLNVNNSAPILVKNGTIARTSEEAARVVYLGTGAKVTFEDVRIEGPGQGIGFAPGSGADVVLGEGTVVETAGAAIIANSASANATITIKDGATVTSTGGYAIQVAGENARATVNIEGGAITGAGTAAVHITNQAKLNISGGTVTSTRAGGNAIDAESGATVAISGGVFTSKGATVVSDGATFTITGGYYSDDAGNGEGFTLPEGEALMKIIGGDYDGYYKLGKPVCSIGDNLYASLDDAKNSGDTSADTIKMLADTDEYVYFDKSWKLDLNGHTISSSSEARTLFVASGVSLEINDTSDGKDGKVLNTFTGDPGTLPGCAIYTVQGKVTVNAGTISCDNGYGIFGSDVTAKVAINDGAIIIGAEGKSVGHSVSASGGIAINGGLFSDDAGNADSIVKPSGQALEKVGGDGEYADFYQLKDSLKAFNVTAESKEYTGEALEAEPVFTPKAGSATVAPEDYTLVYEADSDNASLDENGLPLTVGIYKVVAKATEDGAYAGTESYPFSFEVLGIPLGSIEATGEFVYNGEPQAPTTIVVKDRDGNELDPATDYKISYSSDDPNASFDEETGVPVNAATYTVTAKGNGNYSGEVTDTYTITPKSIEGAVVEGPGSQEYTGSPVVPAESLLTITLDEPYGELDPATDFKVVSCSENIDHGIAQLTVEGAGNYCGTVSKAFQIDPRSISVGKATITVVYPDGESAYEYTGEPIVPTLEVTVPGIDEPLTAGKDYTVSCAGNLVPGTATAIVFGEGNFTSGQTVTFEIAAAPVEISIADIDPQLYTGEPIEPAEVTVTPAGATYDVVYSDNVEPGTATVTVTATGSYTGTATATFTITAPVAATGGKYYASLQEAIDAADEDGVVELLADTEEAISIAEKWLDIDLGGNTLTLPENGALTVSDGAKAVISGGSVVASGDSAIVSDDALAILDGVTVEGAGSVLATVNGGVITVDGGTYIGTLIVDEDGLINVNGGWFSEPVPADCAGSGLVPSGRVGDAPNPAAPYTVVEPIRVTMPDFLELPYSGEAQLGVITYADGCTVAGDSEVNVGSYEATVSLPPTSGLDAYVWDGEGIEVDDPLFDYVGTSDPITGTWKIVAANLADATITTENAVYDGQPHAGITSVTLGELALVEGQDYTVTYTDAEGNPLVDDEGNPIEGAPTKLGTYTATITAVDGGNFTGEASATFEITRADATALINDVVAAVADVAGTRLSDDGGDVVPGDEWVTADEQKPMLDAIADASAVAENPESTEADIAAAQEALAAARAKFDDSKKGVEPDKSALEAAIAAAQAAENNTPTSADGSDVGDKKWTTEAEKKAQDDAIAAAQQVLDNEKATQDQIDAATEAMNNATSTYNANKKLWHRIWGATAPDTMKNITDRFGKTSTAIITTDATYRDALAASPLAGRYGAVVLMTKSGSLTAQTKAALKAAGVKTVYIVGSTKEVSKKVESQIKAAGVKTVKRINGSTPSQRAVAAAKATGKRSNTVIIATQKDYRDALSVAPYAYATKSPILYPETNKKLSAATLKYIKSAGYKKAIIVGGPLALPDSIDTQLVSAGISKNNITRLAGRDAYKTSALIARWTTGKLPNNKYGSYKGKTLAYVKFQPSTKMSADRLGVSTGQNWLDALAGAALLGKNKSVMLLADAKYAAKSDFTQAVTFCEDYKPQIKTAAYVFGGVKAVQPKVWNALVASTK